MVRPNRQRERPTKWNCRRILFSFSAPNENCQERFQDSQPISFSICAILTWSLGKMQTSASPNNRNEYVHRFVESLKDRKLCAWCCSDGRIYRSKLCRHCYEVSRKLAAAEKRAAAVQNPNKHLASGLRYKVRLYAKMKQLCITDGDTFRSLANSHVSAWDVENYLSALSKRLLRRDLFWGCASLLGSCFSPAQRRFLAYLLWKILSAHNRRHRQDKASYIVITEHS